METIKHYWRKIVLRLAIAICAIFFFPVLGYSLEKDISSMFKEEVLQKWHERYSPNMLWNFAHVIKPVLTQEELTALQYVKLEHPLKGKRGGPFEYYANLKDRSIVIPILPFKFLDELTIAVAWLSVNGYTTQTLFDYVAMLKYQSANKFPNSRYPTPLKALHIPENALKNSIVDRFSQDLLKLTYIYILSRELGLIYFAAPYYTSKQFLSERSRSTLILSSDVFALELIKRIGAPPHSITLYIKAQTYWTPNRSDFASEKDYFEYLNYAPESTLFSKELSLIADLMIKAKEDYARLQDDKLTWETGIEEAAREIFNLTEILESESLQKKIKRSAETMTIDDLRPRHE